jgi:hypothetical protein
VGAALTTLRAKSLRRAPGDQAVAAKLNELAILDGLKRTDYLW